MCELQKRTLLISGCNRGIGKAILTRFCEGGYNIIACVRSKSEEFTHYCNLLETKFGNSIKIFEMDLSSSDSIKSTLKKIHESKVQIDVLVNNAGIHLISTLSMTSMSKLRELMQINFFSHVEITQFVSRWMQKQNHGVIINIGSIGGLDAVPGYSAYGCSKMALMYFTKTIAKELGCYNIRVNALAPGLIKTEMLDDISDEIKAEMLGRSDLGRFGSPTEVADLVYYLSSDQASYITGQFIRIDGGL